MITVQTAKVQDVKKQDTNRRSFVRLEQVEKSNDSNLESQSESYLNIYGEPSTSSEVIYKATKDSGIIELGTYGNYIEVDCDGYIGFIESSKASGFNIVDPQSGEMAIPKIEYINSSNGEVLWSTVLQEQEVGSYLNVPTVTNPMGLEATSYSFNGSNELPISKLSNDNLQITKTGNILKIYCKSTLNNNTSNQDNTPKSGNKDNTKPSQSGNKQEVKPSQSGDKQEVKPSQSGDKQEVKPSQSGDKEENKPSQDGNKGNVNPSQSGDKHEDNKITPQKENNKKPSSDKQEGGQDIKPAQGSQNNTHKETPAQGGQDAKPAQGGQDVKPSQKPQDVKPAQKPQDTENKCTVSVVNENTNKVMNTKTYSGDITSVPQMPSIPKGYKIGKITVNGNTVSAYPTKVTKDMDIKIYIAQDTPTNKSIQAVIQYVNQSTGKIISTQKLGSVVVGSTLEQPKLETPNGCKLVGFSYNGGTMQSISDYSNYKFIVSGNGVITVYCKEKAPAVKTLSIKGLDISNWQGNVNFTPVKNAGYNTVIILAGDGTNFTSPTLESQYKAAKAADMNIGFYHFFRPNQNIEEQAQMFWNQIKGKSFDVYPVLDVEVGNGDVTNQVLEFMNDFKKLSGLDCIIYTGYNFANNNLDSRLAKYKCWIADYGPSQAPSTNIWSNKDYVGWQYTDSGQVSGLSNSFDMDKFTSGIYINGDYNVPTSNPQDEGTTVTVTASSLCMNEHPHPNDGIITYLHNGDVVKVLGENSNGWYKVSHNGQVGWISSYYTTAPTGNVPVISSNQVTTTITASSLCMNQHPQPNDGIITYLHSGDVVTVLGENSNGWYKVMYKGQIGWIGSAYTTGIGNSQVPTMSAISIPKEQPQPTSIFARIKSKFSRKDVTENTHESLAKELDSTGRLHVVSENKTAANMPNSLLIK